MTSIELAREVYHRFCAYKRKPIDQEPCFEEIYKLSKDLRNKQIDFNVCKNINICLFLKEAPNNVEEERMDINWFVCLLCLIIIAFISNEVYKWIRDRHGNKRGSGYKPVRRVEEPAHQPQVLPEPKEYLILATETAKLKEAFPDFNENKPFIAGDIINFRSLPWYLLARQDKEMLKTIKQTLSQSANKDNIIFSVKLDNDEMSNLDKSASDPAKRRGIEALAGKELSFMGTIDNLLDASRSFYLRN